MYRISLHYGRKKEMAYKQELWDEAKKKCRIGDEEIRMAKEMGLNPKSLIKNIPNKSEMWKAHMHQLNYTSIIRRFLI